MPEHLSQCAVVFVSDLPGPISHSVSCLSVFSSSSSRFNFLSVHGFVYAYAHVENIVCVQGCRDVGGLCVAL
jgi:hypothetical protein